MYQIEGKMVMIMLGFITNMDVSYAYFPYVLFTFMFTWRISILPIGFIYRYAVICR